MTENAQMASFFLSIKFFVHKHLLGNKIRNNFFLTFFGDFCQFGQVRLFLCHKWLSCNDLRRKWTAQKQIGTQSEPTFS